MHIMAVQGGAHDDSEPVDLGQTPGDVVVLSAADTELALLCDAFAGMRGRASGDDLFSLRLANLLQLRHNYSIDLYAEQVLSGARVVVVRLLGGRGYWPYGLDILHGLAERGAFQLIVLPGDDKPDPALEAYSSVPGEVVRSLHDCFVQGGVANATAALEALATLLEPGAAGALAADPQRFIARWPKASPVPPFGLYWPGRSRVAWDDFPSLWDTGAAALATSADTPCVPIVFYRALAQAGDHAGIDALVGDLLSRNIRPLPMFVASLKNDACIAFVGEALDRVRPQAIINTTAFALGTVGGHAGGADWQSATGADLNPFPGAGDAMVFQVPLSSGHIDMWRDSAQGFGPRDVAMHVALPEVDGRVLTRAVSFKGDRGRDPLTQLHRVGGMAIDDRSARVAEQVQGWLRLRETRREERRVAIVLANYPNRDGRIGNGVGLDTPASVVAILRSMAKAGYDTGAVPASGDELISLLLAGPTNAGIDPGRAVPARGSGPCDHLRPVLSLDEYTRRFAALPLTVRGGVTERWGAPESDPMVRDGVFHLPAVVAGSVAVAIQPARGYNIDPKATYHDPDLVPTHNYLAFYLWVRAAFDAHAVIHAGKHGNLEWLPGKALALSEDCYPDAVLASLPNIYPFIVSDPGEGSQAKRRTSAVIVDHMTPPMTRAESHGVLRDLEVLTDEYYAAAPVDARRAGVLADEILATAERLGITRDLGLTIPKRHAGGPNTNDREARQSALATLDNHLCDLKELQIRDGLHVFGESPQRVARRDTLVALLRVPDPSAVDRHGHGHGHGHGRGAGDGQPSAVWAQGSLLRALAYDLGLAAWGDGGPGFDPLDVDFAALWTGPRPEILCADADDPWRTAGDTVERLEALAADLVEGVRPPAQTWSATQAVLERLNQTIAPRLDACGPQELAGLHRALDGRFLSPGPSGAPTRGRADVLPTGRNFFSLDSRTLPTPTAWELGRRSAEAVIERYLQDHGDWPRAIAMSAWGTANMRTGGDDIAQALALMGVKPTWEAHSGRVTGYEIIPLSRLNRPRVDVTFRVSGFFRDAFPAQIDLIDAAARAVAALKDEGNENPLALRVGREREHMERNGMDPATADLLSGARVFGSKPGAYGAGLQAAMDEDIWENRGDLAEAYIAWGQYIYGKRAEGMAAPEALRSRLGSAEAVLHNQDNREHDILDSDDYYQFEGGLAVSIEAVKGAAVPVFHNDHSRPERPIVRPLEEEMGRVVRGRAANPKWIAGVMRHGYKGAFEMAATVDYLFAFAATTRAVGSHHFDALFDAYIEDAAMRTFLMEHNPDACLDMAERFGQAIERDFWKPRRNSARARLEEIMAEVRGEPTSAGRTAPLREENT